MIDELVIERPQSYDALRKKVSEYSNQIKRLELEKGGLLRHINSLEQQNAELQAEISITKDVSKRSASRSLGLEFTTPGSQGRPPARSRQAAKIFDLLYKYRNETVKYDHILHYLWGSTIEGRSSQTLKTYFMSIRKSLPEGMELITEPGVGVMLKVDIHQTRIE